MQIHAYLAFNGQCRDAFSFYEEVLGGEITTMMTFGESPMASEVPKDWHPRILHAALSVGDSLLMASDNPPDQESPATGFSVSLFVEDPNEAERLFDALVEGGEVKMPMQETFWASRFGMLKDRYGTPWMINASKEA